MDKNNVPSPIYSADELFENITTAGLKKSIQITDDSVITGLSWNRPENDFFIDVKIDNKSLFSEPIHVSNLKKTHPDICFYSLFSEKYEEQLRLKQGATIWVEIIAESTEIAKMQFCCHRQGV